MDTDTAKMDMETDPPTPHGQPQKHKPKRILACVLCQQKKIKCDRKFPCANCIKSNTDCQPAVAVKRRRRTKPELEILSCIRKYESLLRENKIAFEPLIGVPSNSSSRMDDNSMQMSNDMDADDDGSFPSGSTDFATPSTVNDNERVFSVKRFWQLLDEKHNDDAFSDVSESEKRPDVAKTAWDGIIENDSHLMFGSPASSDVDLSTLHPTPAEIFKLWQIYLQNVDPLLKVTHIPTLQARIVDAISHIADIDSNLEALLFSVYAISTMTLDEDECLRFFGLPKKTLSTRYHFGCQLALTNCGFLRTNDLDCLTAMYLYLVAVMPVSLPGSLSSLLAITIRIAQRIGIDMETHGKTPLEAELGRRLWWSLVLFDSRISELADAGTTTLTPLWNAKLPLNANDIDFRADMKEPPPEEAKPTEAIFAVVRCMLGDALRHSKMHLRHIFPALQVLIKDETEQDNLTLVENKIESKYLCQCDPDIPIQYMTTWMTRGFIAKAHLFKFYAPINKSDVIDLDRDKSMEYAISMLHCDTKIWTWPPCAGMAWFTWLFFPFFGYLHVLPLLKATPLCKHAQAAWDAMSENHNARFGFPANDKSPFFRLSSKKIIQAWEARETALLEQGLPVNTPRIVLSVKSQIDAESTRPSPDDTAFNTPNLSNMYGLSYLNFPDLTFGSTEPILETGSVPGANSDFLWQNSQIPTQFPIDPAAPNLMSNDWFNIGSS